MPERPPLPDPDTLVPFLTAQVARMEARKRRSSSSE